MIMRLSRGAFLAFAMMVGGAACTWERPAVDSSHSIDLSADVKQYERRIWGVLPKGWAVAREDATTLVVTREKEVRGELIAPSMPAHVPGRDRFTPYKVTITLRVLSRIAPAERDRLVEENERAAEAWLREHPRKPSEKPVLPPNQHLLPTHYDAMHSFVLSSLYAGPGAGGIRFDYASRDEAVECGKVYEAIEGMFRKYDSKR